MSLVCVRVLKYARFCFTLVHQSPKNNYIFNTPHQPTNAPQQPTPQCQSHPVPPPSPVDTPHTTTPSPAP